MSFLVIGAAFFAVVWWVKADIEEHKLETEVAIDIALSLLYKQPEAARQMKAMSDCFKPQGHMETSDPNALEGFGGTQQELERQLKIMRKILRKLTLKVEEFADRQEQNEAD